MTAELILYSGQQCHLCDIAAELIAQNFPNHWAKTQKVDVRPDPQLYHLYGARIPVLKRLDTQSELGWPFDQAQLQAFLL